MGCEHCGCVKGTEQKEERTDLYKKTPNKIEDIDCPPKYQIMDNPYREPNEQNLDTIPETNPFPVKKEENENENEIKIENENILKNKEENESLSSNFLSTTQNRNETLFDYFNDVRLFPENYVNEAENHGVLDIIQNAKNKKEKPSYLIKNPFYNIVLGDILTKNHNNINDDELKNEIENEKQISSFDKDIYIIEANVDNPNEAIWNLLEENKNKNGGEILSEKIDYLIVSNIPIIGTQNFKACFLFLKKKN